MGSDAEDVFNIVTEQLPDAGIDFLMIGGHAVNFYGFARATLDIDFMVAANDETKLRSIMSKAGFTNVASHENVIFFNRPESPLRIDFLKVTPETMRELLSHAVTAHYGEKYTVKVPQLEDLLAMKIFALHNSNLARRAKDVLDITHLAVEHEVPSEKLKALCDKYGSTELYEKLCQHIEGLKNY